MIKSKAIKEIKSAVDSIQSKLVTKGTLTELPLTGLPDTAVLSLLNTSDDIDWKAGRVSGAVYYAPSHVALLNAAYAAFSTSNPLHPELWPSVRRMESEIVSMMLHLYNAPTGCGNVTYGGTGIYVATTESILMAVKTARDAAGVRDPEIIVPVTVHAAFDKAAHYFGVKIHHIPLSNDAGVDVALVERFINSNTVLLVGSAPNFPHGIIDNIPALGKLAIKYSIPLHVDACLGGFIIPFMKDAGFPLPHAFDFSVDGVSSISVDPHKYGFAPKGNSVIMYKSAEYRKYQYHVLTDWPGGVYASPSIAGSRAGGLIAGCWAALVSNGHNGYVKSTRKIVSCTRKIVDAVRCIPELVVIGDPLTTVVAFAASPASPVKTYAVADLLSRKGWHLNILQFPPAIHIACTLSTVADDLIKDVIEVVEVLKADPTAGAGDIAAIYGTAASVPDRSVIGEVAHGFLDALTMFEKTE